jgi:poly(3-hydroxybutyrate) depolymerase
MMKSGFKMLNPAERFFLDYVDVYKNAHDGKYLEKYRKFGNWDEYTQNLPGRMYLQIVKELFKENRLVRGEMYILGERVDLERMSQPLTLMAGSKDDITLPEQLFNIRHYVNSFDIARYLVPAGHIGVFMGEKNPSRVLAPRHQVIKAQ